MLTLVSQGEASIPGNLLHHLLGQIGHLQQNVLNPNGLTLTGLTDREHRMLKLAADGHSTTEIAQAIGYSERTVKTVFNGLVTRFALRNRTQAVAYAIRQGWI
ncbi:helix-turn-helix transcriptional regulator [Streptomyces lavendulae]|uniref:response regulator transcription factor n=1 Tax=Streptomyces lavendulae TaxID=1914 RepID=UPI0033E58DB3